MTKRYTDKAKPVVDLLLGLAAEEVMQLESAIWKKRARSEGPATGPWKRGQNWETLETWSSTEADVAYVNSVPTGNTNIVLKTRGGMTSQKAGSDKSRLNLFLRSVRELHISGGQAYFE
jgi:hypothetical protein